MQKTKIEWADYRKGSHRTRSGNYFLVYAPTHPFAKSKGHIYEHRYVIEKHLGRFLQSNEHVHHRDGNGRNNQIENLELITALRHVQYHDLTNPRKREKGTKALILYASSQKKERKEIQCACGCGGKLITPDKKGRDRKFILGHNQSNRKWKWKHAKNKD